VSADVLLTTQDGRSASQTYRMLLAEATFDLELPQGWSLLSIPIRLLVPNVETVFRSTPEAGHIDSPLWQWDGQVYTTTTAMEACRGYWLHCTSPTTLTLTGHRIDGQKTQLRNGWNLFGPAVECRWPNDFVLPDSLFWWDTVSARYGLFREEDSLQPGRGYWLYTSGADQILQLP